MNIKEAFEFIKANPGARCWALPRAGAGITWHPEKDHPVWATPDGGPSITSVMPGLRPKDVLGEWVVEEAPKQPEFVEGAQELERFPWAFMLPVVNQLLQESREVDVAGYSVWDRLIPNGASVVRWYPGLFAKGPVPPGARQEVLVVESHDWIRLPDERREELLKEFKRVVVVRPARTEGEMK